MVFIAQQPESCAGNHFELLAIAAGDQPVLAEAQESEMVFSSPLQELPGFKRIDFSALDALL